MTGTSFYHAAVAVALGMAAQVLAGRFAVPSIIILLAFGVAAGPDGLGLLNPDVFGAARADLVALAVTVILFEGALALRLENLRQQQRSLTLLLTVGAAISMGVGTWAAHAVIGMPWSIASLYGALVIVTGPTVVTPLLTRLTVDRPVRDLLISEGVLIDPIGAIVAIVAAEYLLGRAEAWEAGWLLFAPLGVGALLGGLAGMALAFALRRQWIPEDLRNPTVLGVVLAIAAFASHVSSEAGLMAAVVQGVVMANSKVRELGRLRAFKEELTVVLLSFVFILLAADLPLASVRELGWPALLVVGLVAWVARPLAVFLCTVGSSLTFQQRLFASWICPRGIVAASVAGLFSIALTDAQIPGGKQLEALVFVTVALTVTVQGLTAGLVAGVLGVHVPALQGTLIVGADHLGRLLARLLLSRGRQAVLIDVNPQHCRAARAEGLPTYNGDALSVDSLEEAGIRYADTVLALTRNHELNTLIGLRVRDNFHVERILTVSEAAPATAGQLPFPGNFPGLDEVNHQLRVGRSRLVLYEKPAADQVDRNLADLPYGSGEFALLLLRLDRTYVASSEQMLAESDRLLCLGTADEVSPLASVFATATEPNAHRMQCSS